MYAVGQWVWFTPTPGWGTKALIVDEFKIKLWRFTVFQLYKVRVRDSKTWDHWSGESNFGGIADCMCTDLLKIGMKIDDIITR